MITAFLVIGSLEFDRSSSNQPNGLPISRNRREPQLQSTEAATRRLAAASQC